MYLSTAVTNHTRTEETLKQEAGDIDCPQSDFW